MRFHTHAIDTAIGRLIESEPESVELPAIVVAIPSDAERLTLKLPTHARVDERAERSQSEELNAPTHAIDAEIAPPWVKEKLPPPCQAIPVVEDKAPQDLRER